MRRITWLLRRGQPHIEVMLREPVSGHLISRTVLADTGAGPRHSAITLILSESDCQHFARKLVGMVSLAGFISGWFQVYELEVEIPQLQFTGFANSAAVASNQLPLDLDGIACFAFLNRFTYGNFGSPNQFGLEVP